MCYLLGSVQTKKRLMPNKSNLLLSRKWTFTEINIERRHYVFERLYKNGMVIIILHIVMYVCYSICIYRDNCLTSTLLRNAIDGNIAFNLICTWFIKTERCRQEIELESFTCKTRCLLVRLPLPRSI